MKESQKNQIGQEIKVSAKRVGYFLYMCYFFHCIKLENHDT